MRTADLYRELRRHNLEEVEVFRSAALKRLTFRFGSDGKVLKITYWANTDVTAADVIAAVVANRDKAVKLSMTERWVPESATVHLD